MYLQEVRWWGVGRIKVALDRDRWGKLVNPVMSLLGSIKSGELLD
jgi:hypothetical protein